MTHTVSMSHLNPSPAAPCWPDVLDHRDYLLRFARRKLHDPSLAEDVVHDVFEAVLRGRARFAGRSALRSWLVGILKNKLVDLIRDRVRYSALDADADDSDASGNQQVCGDPGPDDLAEHRERLALVMARIAQLPEGLREAMEWRVLNDEPTEVVCERLGITQDNLFVRLHRARKMLAPAPHLRCTIPSEGARSVGQHPPSEVTRRELEPTCSRPDPASAALCSCSSPRCPGARFPP